jgi:hypothetical protein
MNQNVIILFYPTNRDINMQDIIKKYSSKGWIVKQVSTTYVNKITDVQKIVKPSIAITLLLEKTH